MIFILKMKFTFVYDRKNENHWSLLLICYSLLGIQTPLLEQPCNKSDNFNKVVTSF